MLLSVQDNDDEVDRKEQRSLDEGGDGGGGGVVVRVLVDGDREDVDPALPSDRGQDSTGQEKEKSVARAGKPKRKRPANRWACKRGIQWSRVA